MYRCVAKSVLTLLALYSLNYMGHNYIGHNCIGHNHIRHNHIGHNYTGHNYIGVSPSLEGCSLPAGVVTTIIGNRDRAGRDYQDKVEPVYVWPM